MTKKKSVNWVVKHDGKEVERHEKIGEKFGFIAKGEYVGEKLTFHPFLRSPSDNLCIKTTIGEYLLFDGENLSWIDKQLNVKKQWPGVSGDGKQKDEKQNGGPIPEGKWVVLQRQRQQTPDQTWWQRLVNSSELKEFGTDRIGLIPFTKTETHGRKEFFIHGGKEAGSGHGVDLIDKMKGFVDEFVKGERDLVLVVNMKKKELKVSENEEYMILNQKYATIMKSLAGKPYILNANGPNSFDCSGAVCWGLRKTANPNFGDYTADDLFRKFTLVSESSEPGAVKFYDYTADGKIDHVTSIIDNSQMVHPSSGAGIIEIRAINYLNSYTEQKGGIIYNRIWNWEAIKK